MTYSPIRRRLMAGLLFLGAAPLGAAPLAARAQNTRPCEIDQDLGGVFVVGEYYSGGERATGDLELPVPSEAIRYEGGAKLSTMASSPLPFRLRLFGQVEASVFKIQGLAMQVSSLEVGPLPLLLKKVSFKVEGVDLPTSTPTSRSGGWEAAVRIVDVPQPAKDKVLAALAKGARVSFSGQDDGSPAGKVMIDFKTPDIRPKLPVAGKALQKLMDDGLAGRCEPVTTDCFLTTAAVHTVGLADDCWELRVLRAFRDGPLAALPGGRALIADYYERAPAIVERINARGDAARVWLATYWTGIVPSAIAARLGLRRTALALYRRMIERLQRLT